MRIPGRKYRDEWLPNFYPSRLVGEYRVRVSRTGKLILLTADEDRSLEEVFMDGSLFLRLERSGHIITKANAQRVLEDLHTWFSGTYAGPQLHIVVTTKRCNLNCTYCHMLPEPVQADQAQFDLQPATADAIVRFILSTPNPQLMVEFQGGEPFLNFSGIVRVVETAKQLNASVGKELDFTVVSNLLVADDEQLRYCADNSIHISFSLNGPPDLHDHFRITRSGGGSFEQVMRRIVQIRQQYPGLLSASPLCVVSTHNASQLIPTIQFFHEAGFDSVAILKLRQLGNARFSRMPFDINVFLHYYLEALDYILEKNDQGDRVYSERMVRVVLAKILGDADVGFVDWRNPCGDVSCVLTYDYDGEILPSDEARSMREEFSLGNVHTTTYDDLIRTDRTFRTMNLSLRDRDPICRECAYNPYCGVAPILDFARTGDCTPHPYESEECIFTLAVLDWTIRRYMERPIPLVRMLPGASEWFASLLASNEEYEVVPEHRMRKDP